MFIAILVIFSSIVYSLLLFGVPFPVKVMQFSEVGGPTKVWDESENGGRRWDEMNFIGGCGIEILWLERDLFILTGGMWDSFKIDGGMQDEKQKIAGYGHNTENCSSNQAGSE